MFKRALQERPSYCEEKDMKSHVYFVQVEDSDDINAVNDKLRLLLAKSNVLKGGERQGTEITYVVSDRNSNCSAARRSSSAASGRRSFVARSARMIRAGTAEIEVAEKCRGKKEKRTRLIILVAR